MPGKTTEQNAALINALVKNLQNVGYSGGPTPEHHYRFEETVTLYLRLSTVPTYDTDTLLDRDVAPTGINSVEDRQLHDFLVVACEPNSPAQETVLDSQRSGVMAWLSLRLAFLKGHTPQSSEARLLSEFHQLQCGGDEYDYLSSLLRLVTLLTQRPQCAPLVTYANITERLLRTHTTQTLKAAAVRLGAHTATGDTNAVVSLLKKLMIEFEPLPVSSAPVARRVEKSVPPRDLSRHDDKTASKIDPIGKLPQGVKEGNPRQYAAWKWFKGTTDTCDLCIQTGHSTDVCPEYKAFRTASLKAYYARRAATEAGELDAGPAGVFPKFVRSARAVNLEISSLSNAPLPCVPWSDTINPIPTIPTFDD